MPCHLPKAAEQVLGTQCMENCLQAPLMAD